MLSLLTLSWMIYILETWSNRIFLKISVQNAFFFPSLGLGSTTTLWNHLAVTFVSEHDLCYFCHYSLLLLWNKRFELLPIFSCSSAGNRNTLSFPSGSVSVTNNCLEFPQKKTKKKWILKYFISVFSAFYPAHTCSRVDTLECRVLSCS